MTTGIPQTAPAATAPARDLNGEIEDPTTGARRRTARRRPAGPSRNRVAANDDGPSIGGLIFALQQKPSNFTYKLAAFASVIWAAIGISFAMVRLGADAPGQRLDRPARAPDHLLHGCRHHRARSACCG